MERAAFLKKEIQQAGRLMKRAVRSNEWEVQEG